MRAICLTAAVLLAMPAHATEDGEDPRPQETRIGVGAIVGTAGASGPTVRVRTLGGVSVDLTLGTTLLGSSGAQRFAGQDLDFQNSTAAVASALSLRLPISQQGRTDVLWTTDLGGSIAWGRGEQSGPGAGPGQSETLTSRSRRDTASIGTGVALDHWVSSSAVITGGLGLLVAELARDRLRIDDGEAETLPPSQSLGLSTRASVGVVVFF